MSWLYRHLVRPVLFTHSPEEIHEQTIRALGVVGRSELLTDAVTSFCEAPALPVRLMGLEFPNPVGLAAGMDKNGEAVPAWAALGFGFTELGAVTWHAQPGNPQPRVFRAVADEAIVNRMGFNNEGAERMAERLADWKQLGRWPKHPVGINLGKSKVTPLEQAAEDYAKSMRVLLPHLDFFVVNVSSPNTPNLRQLQDKQALNDILTALQEVGKGTRPVLVKVAPDLTFQALDDILELVEPRSVAGIVATNTTIARPESTDPELQRVYAETGGLSGRPLKERSTEVIRHLYKRSEGKVPIIGVGGIFSTEDAWQKVLAGASLLQVYTGLVYEGPWMVRAIVAGLLEKLAASEWDLWEEAVGKNSN